MSASQQPAPRAFLLGMDIEEVYMVFGEAIQLATGGLVPDHYDFIESKAGNVRDALLDLGCPHALIQRFERVAASIHRAGDPLVGGLEALAAATATGEAELGALMGEVRDELRPDDGRLYDLGVMLARLHLCLRIVGMEDPGPPEMMDLYGSELARTVPIVFDMVNRAEAENVIGGRMDPQLAELVRRLSEQIATWDGGSVDWSRATLVRLDRVFGAVGAVKRSPF